MATAPPQPSHGHPPPPAPRAPGSLTPTSTTTPSHPPQPQPQPPITSLTHTSHPRPLYLIRFTQTHLSFRPAELAAMETLLNAASSLSPRGTRARLKRRQAPTHAGTDTDIPASRDSKGSDDHDGTQRIQWNGAEKLERLGGDGKRVRVEVVRYEEGSPFCVVAFRVVRAGFGRRGVGGAGEVQGEEGAHIKRSDGAGKAGPSLGGGRIEEGATTNMRDGEGATGQKPQAGAKGSLDAVGASDAVSRTGAMQQFYATTEVAIEEKDQAGTNASLWDGENDENEVECEEDSYDEELLAEIARRYISRSVQAKGIYEIWGHAATDGRRLDGLPNTASCTDSEVLAEKVLSQTTTNTSAPLTTDAAIPPLYDNLHASTRALSGHRWAPYQTSSTLKFKLSVDSFNHARSAPEQRDIINSFAYLDFSGLVRMKDFNQEWVVFEEWLGPSQLQGVMNGSTAETENTTISEGEPAYENTYRRLGQLWFTRAISSKTLRPLIEKHDLKKRPYISTTSMDAELALVTANLALAEPGKMFLDPFCGTGGFLIAAAELGAWVLGSDIDGRSFRGKGDRGLSGGVGKNVNKYGLQTNMGGCFTGDLVNSPLLVGGDVGGKARRWLDGIIADPPYGVREGLKVLGARKAPEEPEGAERKPHLIDGVPAHTLPGYIAPKKPYSFERMLDDVLQFASKTLVDGGRLAFWMPSANENEKGEEEETAIPQHPGLTLLHVCVQRFNRWSRRLLVYERKAGEVDMPSIVCMVRSAQESGLDGGGRADDLNPFRRRYFQAFAVEPDTGHEQPPT